MSLCEAVIASIANRATIKKNDLYIYIYKLVLCLFHHIIIIEIVGKENMLLYV